MPTDDLDAARAAADRLIRYHAHYLPSDVQLVARTMLRYGEALQVAEHARASALLLNSGHDDHALQDRILDHLGEILGPLPGDG